MKLHLGLLVNDLGQRFGISAAIVSRITTHFIKFLANEFRTSIIQSSIQHFPASFFSKSFEVFPYNKV